MTKEQIRDDVILKMSKHLDKVSLSILESVLTEDLAKLGETTELATIDDTNEYLTEMFYTFKGAKLSSKTIKAYKYSLDKLMLSTGKKLTDITSIDIECFLAKIRKNNSEVSTNNHRRNISAFYTWLVKKRFITFNPCIEVEPYKEIMKPIDHLDSLDMDKVKAGCKTIRERAIVEFLRCTALRVEEVISINVNDVDFIKGSVSVYGIKTKCYRTVFLDDVALHYIREYIFGRGLSIDSQAPLFASEKCGKRLKESGYQNVMKEIGKRVGLHLYVHLFRKSCATNIVKRGGTISDSGIYLGHKDSTVTGKHYTYISDEQRRSIFDKYVKAV